MQITFKSWLFACLCLCCVGRVPAQQTKYAFCFALVFSPQHAYYSDSFATDQSEADLEKAFKALLTTKYGEKSFSDLGCTTTHYSGMPLTSLNDAEAWRLKFAKSRGSYVETHWTYDPNERSGGEIVWNYSGTGAEEGEALIAAKQLAQHSVGSELASFGPHTCSPHA